MNTKKIEVFLKTVELCSLSGAAKALNMTQSGVSHIIADLEHELELPLLIRSRAGACLTDEGRRVLPYMKGIMDYSRGLEAEAMAIRGLDAGTIRIGTFSSVAVNWLPAIIKEFQRDYPLIELQLMNGDYYDVDRWLAEGSVDVGFITLPTKLSCKTIPLLDDRILAILPKDHPLAGLEVLPVKALQSEPLIGLPESSNQDARRALENAGINPKFRFTTKDDYAIIAMVEQGLGVSIMPELLISGRTDKVRVMELDPPSRRTIALALPAAEPTGPATRRFCDYVAKSIKRI